jgi:hypothetical protein
MFPRTPIAEVGIGYYPPCSGPGSDSWRNAYPNGALSTPLERLGRNAN